jgi:hypothetical protein
MCPPELRSQVRGAAGQRRLDAVILTQRFFVRNNIFFVWTWYFPLNHWGVPGVQDKAIHYGYLKGLVCGFGTFKR